MAGVFTGAVLGSQQYQHSLEEIRKELQRTPDQKVLANSDEALVDYFTGTWLLHHLEEDPNRQRTAHQEREFRPSRDTRFGPSEYELVYAVVKIPLIPHESNAVALQLTNENGWPIYRGIEQAASFQSQDDILIIRAPVSEIEAKVALAQQLMGLINEAVDRHTPQFLGRLWELVRGRRAEVAAQSQEFEATMSKLGVSVARKPGAVEPVNVRVKRNVQILREGPARSAGPAEPHLTRESIAEIVGLLDQSGKGFETAPSTYSKLGEEELRDILIGHLNAVFTSNAATGETFSKHGKTDILLNIPGGSILITECKIWHGAKLYGKTIDQLFSYLTWRHTVAVLITFSRNKGLSQVVSEADQAVQAHGSYWGGWAVRTSTYRVSSHEHPSDPDKSVEVHHLFFDLYAGS